MARRAAVIRSSSPRSSAALPYARLAHLLLPGLSLGGGEPGTEGGAGDAAKNFSNPAIDYKFSTRNMVRENASVSALSLCANAAMLGDVVPESLATSSFLDAARSSSADVRAYGAHGLGEAGDLNGAKVIDAIADLLANE